MCGIAGVAGSQADGSRVSMMIVALHHRGPDSGSTLECGESSVLGHRRLSIIDVDARSDQPFRRGNLTLVYNGEIYNFAEIRQELEPFVAFTTLSDTEVLLEAWRRWGPDCLRKMRGMFSFAIHDAVAGTTHIVRDPLGIKPLFYLPLASGGVAFASELKAIVAAFRERLTPDLSSVLASLVWVWVPEEYCVWSPVRKLKPGHMLVVDKQGRIQEFQYHKPEQFIVSAPDLVTEDSAVAAVAAAIEDSVTAHLISDVPVNAFLSGGLDSSLVAAIARSHLDRMDAYCIRFGEDARRAEAMTDDAAYARRVARKLDVDLHMIDAQPDMAMLLPEIVRVLDEPIGDSAAIASLLICKEARRNGVKVLLSGMGADELFAGYRKHAANVIAGGYRRLPAVLRSPLEALVDWLPVAGRLGGMRRIRWAKRFLAFAGLPEAAAFMRSYSYMDGEAMRSLAGTAGVKVYDDLGRDHFQTYQSAPIEWDMVNRMCFTDLQRFMVSLNETYTDRSSMAVSTEVRVPFIDRKVVEVAFRIPGALKYRGGTSKYVLKKAAERWLDHDVIYRPKSSFTLPLRAWVRGNLADVVDQFVLSTDGLAGRGWLAPAELRRIVDDDRGGREDNAQLIWQLLTIEQWFRNNGL